MNSEVITLSLQETASPKDSDALYDAVWTLLADTIRRNTKHQSATTILNDYLSDTREDGGADPREIELVFTSPSSACDVQMAVTAHWFELAIAVASAELAKVCKEHGYRLKATKRSPLAVANTKREMVFVAHGDEIVGVRGKKALTIVTDAEGEQSLEDAELSRVETTAAKSAASRGTCGCVFCATVRKGKARAGKPSPSTAAEPAPAPSEATQDQTFKNATSALKHADKCTRLDLSKVSAGRSTRIARAELPKNIGKLTRLRELDTSGTITSALPASLFTIETLERLRLGYVEDLGKDRSLPAEIGALTRLVELRIGGVEKLPKSLLKLRALETLVLGFYGKTLPAFITELASVRRLELRKGFGGDGASLPSLGKMAALTHLTIEGSAQSVNEVELFRLKDLVELRWTGLAAFPRHLHDLPKLERLQLGRTTLTSFPSLSSLPALVELAAEPYELAAWPAALNDVPLRTIHFKNAGSLKSLDGLRSLPALETLVLTETELTELPKTAPSLPKLKTLDIRYARQLKTLPSWVTKLPSLERICLALTAIPESELKALARAKPGLNVDLYII